MQGEAYYDYDHIHRLNSGMLFLGSIQVRSEYARGFRRRKSRSVRILEAEICEQIWPRLASMGTAG